MQVRNQPFEPDVSKRQLLVSTGTFVAGGGIVAAMGSQPSKAAVQASELDIPPASHSGDDGSVSSLDLQVSGNYEFATDAADTLVLTLGVAPEGTENYAAIDKVDEPVSAASGAGQYSLAGSTLDHAALDAATFSADAGETVTKELPVRVTMDVQQGGETVVSALASTVATVEVTNSSVDASAALTGSGKVAIEV